jgi:ATPase subunit of ABC transporter with duplicated ATPase domains
VLAIRYRLSGITWEDLLSRLAGLGFRAALVGPNGSGKTTLLEDLAVRLEERGFRLRRITLHEGDRRLTLDQERILFADLTPRDCLLLDGAEQLNTRAWKRVERASRAGGGLVVTSHRAGLLPALLECETTPELLGEIVRALAGEEAGQPSAAELYARHRGNLREALRELYDWWAER